MDRIPFLHDNPNENKNSCNGDNIYAQTSLHYFYMHTQNCVKEKVSEFIMKNIIMA